MEQTTQTTPEVTTTVTESDAAVAENCETTKETPTTDTSIKKYVKAKTEEKKPEFIISKQVDEKMGTIQKNIDYCNENGCPEALSPAGKFYKSFMNLVDATVNMVVEELRSELKGLLPFCKRKTGNTLSDIIERILSDSKETFTQNAAVANKDGLKKEIEQCKRIYADEYVKVQLLKMF